MVGYDFFPRVVVLLFLFYVDPSLMYLHKSMMYIIGE